MAYYTGTELGLKNCPFCNQEPMGYRVVDSFESTGRWTIFCADCSVKMDEDFLLDKLYPNDENKSLKTLIERWNHREISRSRAKSRK